MSGSRKINCSTHGAVEWEGTVCCGICGSLYRFLPVDDQGSAFELHDVHGKKVPNCCGSRQDWLPVCENCFTEKAATQKMAVS